MGIDELLKRLDESPAETKVETKTETVVVAGGQDKAPADEPLLPIGDQFAEYCKTHTRK